MDTKENRRPNGKTKTITCRFCCIYPELVSGKKYNETNRKRLTTCWRNIYLNLNYKDGPKKSCSV